MALYSPTQFKLGDQSFASRYDFYKLDFKQCVKCRSDKIKEDRFVDGVRMNGDACGTTMFTCERCDWGTSFQYDDSSDCYYYEVQGWHKLSETEVAQRKVREAQNKSG
jgi:hypothetical protein